MYPNENPQTRDKILNKNFKMGTEVAVQFPTHIDITICALPEALS